MYGHATSCELVSDKDLIEQGFDVVRMRQNPAAAVEKAFDAKRRRIYEEQITGRTLADNPGIVVTVLKLVLLWFAAVWILYGILYFI